MTSILKKNVNWGTNTGTGISGQDTGDITLTQLFTNFDAVLIIFSKDDRSYVNQTLWPSWLLQYVFQSYSALKIVNTEGQYWTVWGYSKHGTNNQTWSTATVWKARRKNSVIVDIFGINY